MSRKTIRIAATALAVAGALSPTSVPATAAPLTPELAITTGGSFGRLGPLTDLVVERLLVGDDVAAAKFGTSSPIDDPAREQQVLDQVRKQAVALGVAPDAAAAFFRDQITASKVVQRGLFARWTAHPDEAPTTRPDLGQIRTRLDRLTTELLGQLKATQDVRAQRVPCTVQLALATASAAVLQDLDALHRQALGTAVRSTCG
ncbi:chorismate mutase [Lentzea cavernae]|uniref:chorismate mutase n=1 Tax=Lentzea cavernae TaxID=2020703 RepID=A0ABQ3M0I3_9PSEU|nr:chorismate mutase [Lentzea cavernae]GHH30799.1 chorismate mutase [Lentzea cavernae]